MSDKRTPIILIADNIRSLYNVGSLFRLADGLHLEAIYLCGMTGYPKINDDTRPDWVSTRADKEIRKTGLAGVDAVPFRYFSKTEDALTTARAAGNHIVSLELIDNSFDYRKAKYAFPLAVIVGHETEGVSPNVLEMVDTVVHLPMLGAGQSLNVATATAALLYYLHDRYESSVKP